MSSFTLAQGLAHAKTLGIERLDAQLLLGFVLRAPRVWLLAHDDTEMSPSQWQQFTTLAARRSAGEPLAYILGEKEFHGLMLRVDSDVLVPRPDTETLVDWALSLLDDAHGGPSAPRVVDLGTGSGAIALALKHGAPRAHVWAVERSEAALAVARENGKRLGIEVDWRHGDWWQACGESTFHLAVTNPPYVADEDPHLVALSHEPLDALRAGRDGLDAIRTIITGASAHLVPCGRLLIEHGHDQACAVQSLLSAAGLVDVQSRQDLGGRWRCTGGRLR